MRKMVRNVLIVVLAASMGFAAMAEKPGMDKGMKQMYQTVKPDEATILQKGDGRMYCPNCGMYLPKFYKTGHAVKLRNGEVRQYCSIHCVVEEMEMTELRDKKDQIESIMVVDVDSLKFIDAHKAHYVVGSSKMGTMTGTSKYAFKDAAKAKAFAEANGGKVVGYAQAYEIALNDFAKDMAMLYKKRSSKMYKMGEKIYNTKCNKSALDKVHAHNMGTLKTYIAKTAVCGKGLNDMQLQGVMLYVWDVRMQKFEKSYGHHEVVKKAMNAH